MRRMDKEFKRVGITFEADDFDIMRGPEYDVDRKLVEITGEYIITVTYSAVLDPQLDLWNRHTFDWVGSQNLYPDEMTFGVRFNKWWSQVAGDEEDYEYYEYPDNLQEQIDALYEAGEIPFRM